MQETFLDSVVKLTSHDDSDSLDVSLLMTISELVNCNKASLFRRTSRGQKYDYSLIVGVDFSNDQHQGKWTSNQIIDEPSKALLEAFDLTQPKSIKQKDGTTQVWQTVWVSEFEKVCLSVNVAEIDATQLALIASYKQIYTNYQKILQRSDSDKLTGLLNRNTLEKRLNQFLEQQHHNHQLQVYDQEKRKINPEDSAWLTLIDIDHFKSINDTYGHMCGDEVLLVLSQLMREYFRSSDLLFRYGGEEFLIILSPTSVNDANKLLNGFREKVEMHKFPLIENLTVSIGFTEINEMEYPQSLIEQADKALYYAKENGRNAVHSYQKLITDGQLQDPNQASSKIDLF